MGLPGVIPVQLAVGGVPVNEAVGSAVTSKKPKKATTSYSFFAQQQRPLVKETQPDLNPAEMTKVLKSRFAALSTDGRKQYDESHNEDVKRYEAEMDGFDADWRSKLPAVETKKRKDPPKCPPPGENLVGAKFRRRFEGKWYKGEVKEYKKGEEGKEDEPDLYLVEYEDGDKEDLEYAEFQEVWDSGQKKKKPRKPTEKRILPLPGPTVVGTKIKKEFDGKYYNGVVKKFTKSEEEGEPDLYLIEYADGDVEDLDYKEFEVLWKGSGKPYNSAITSKKKLSADLAEICGFEEGSRGDVIKAVWEYIKNKGLKSSEGIQCDELMEKVFEMKSMKNTQVMGGISPHLTAIEKEKPKEKVKPKKEKEADKKSPAQKTKAAAADKKKVGRPKKTEEPAKKKAKK